MDADRGAFSRLRAELIAAMAARADQLGSAIRTELAKPIALESGRQLQFEIDDLYYGVTLCATGETVLPGEWLDGLLPGDWFQRAEDAAVDWNEIIAEEMCPWFAGCWLAAGGPAGFRPAYLFFHLHPERQYDLDGRRWVSSER